MQCPLPSLKRILLVSFLCDSLHKGCLCCMRLGPSFFGTCILCGPKRVSPNKTAPWSCPYHPRNLRTLSDQFSRSAPLLWNYNTVCTHLCITAAINHPDHFREQDQLAKPQPGKNYFHFPHLTWLFVAVYSCVKFCSETTQASLAFIRAFIDFNKQRKSGTQSRS